MKYQVLSVLCALAFGVFTTANAANAATIFNLGGSGGNLGASALYSEDGINLTASSNSGDLHRDWRGLGVVGGPGQNSLSSDATTNEVLNLRFSQEVSLVSAIVLERRSGFEQFDILDGMNNILGSYTLSGPGSSFQTLSGLDFTGSIFAIRHTSGDGIRLRSLEITTMPIPASLPLLAAALGLFGFLSRRRSAS